jgi:hypothetical protein
LVQNDLETVRVRRGAGFASRCGDGRVLESRGRGAVVGLRLTTGRGGLGRSADLGLELTN